MAMNAIEGNFTAGCATNSSVQIVSKKLLEPLSLDATWGKILTCARTGFKCLKLAKPLSEVYKEGALYAIQLWSSSSCVCQVTSRVVVYVQQMLLLLLVACFLKPN